MRLKTYSKYKQNTYVAKPANAEGYVPYDSEENETWRILYERQIKIISDRAYEAFHEGLRLLAMPTDIVPQCPDISRILQQTTGWQVTPVAALIPLEAFFQLLATQQFPAATFIRRREELDYLQEPDIFHEYFGHCPLLTQPAFADFTQAYGKYALQATATQRIYLARLYWFTVEFGLINTPQGRRIYGGGILSSAGESIYALEDPRPERRPFDLNTVLRTPYRIDEYQSVYYCLPSLNTLYDVMHTDLFAEIARAEQDGDFSPTFSTDDL